MLEIIAIIFVSSIISVGLLELIKKFMPETVNKKLLTVISIGVEVLVSIVLFTAFPVGSFGVFGRVVQYIIVALLTVGLAQFEYSFLAKLVKTIIAKLKK